MGRPAELALARGCGASPEADVQGGVTPGAVGRHGARSVAGLLAVLLLLPANSQAGKKDKLPDLSEVHGHRSGAFTFRTPADWTVEAPQSEPGELRASGGGIVVRFHYRNGEAGFDSLHATCMLDRLADLMEAEPQVKYEYDFAQGQVGGRRALDSAFAVRYDKAVLGHREWRQRNVTIVDKGESLCVIAHVPLPTWKKSRQVQTLLAAVLGSLSFR